VEAALEELDMESAAVTIEPVIAVLSLCVSRTLLATSTLLARKRGLAALVRGAVAGSRQSSGRRGRAWAATAPVPGAPRAVSRTRRWFGGKLQDETFFLTHAFVKENILYPSRYSA